MTTSDRAGNEERLREALTKINAIRDSIVGAQSINWSEHIYPLVAALNEAGFEGLPYPEARENIGTLIERAERAEAALAATPTQTGAEGPAERLTGLPWLREAVKQVRLNDDGSVSIDINTWNVLHLYAFRSGAEVAAAPGLDVEALARALVFRRYGIQVEDANPADVADAEAVAAEYARLTDTAVSR